LFLFVIVQLFGLLDLFAGVLLVLNRFGFSGDIMLFVGALLIIKALVFFGGVVSLLDVLGGVVLIMVAAIPLQAHFFLLGLLALWFLQKGFFSFVPS
jgi:hypothetical protein